MSESNVNIESQGAFLQGLGNASTGILPPQAMPKSKKGKGWQKACMDNLETVGLRQLRDNIKFTPYRRMLSGDFSYQSISFDFDDDEVDSFFTQQVSKLREYRGIPTYVKHYDFIGIIVNTLLGIYNDFQDVFRVDSLDEYSTNEFLRQKTEQLQAYATELWQAELTKLLINKGIDPYRSNFDTEEEYQQFQEELAQQKKALTPDEIQAQGRKGFKVLATEWAQNTLHADTLRFDLADIEREEFIDYLLTGRFFRHHRIGYDYYKPERWRVEETFFSQDIDCKYPQDGEFVGRITRLSPSAVINTFGHLLTATEQEKISNYYNQNDNYSSYSGNGGMSDGEDLVKDAWGQDQIVPFDSYYPHKIQKEYESALGIPMGVRTIKDDNGVEREFADWLPNYGAGAPGGENYSQLLRDDVDVRTDTLQVTEAYWRSYRRIGLITYVNSLGQLTQILTNDDLLNDFLKENEIKKLKSVTLEEILAAKVNDRLHEYENTIIYEYVPEIWKGIKIRANNGQIKDDLYLDIRPLDFQIKANSDFYDFKLPVGGLIGTGIAKKLAPYQVLHNICMNQITDILEKEIGIFFLMDINYLPLEFKMNGNHEDALLSIMDLARNTGILPIDMSKQNTQGNQPVNSFAKQDLTYGSQVEYRWQLAQQYKQEGLQQIGITPQLLGQPNSYTTAEGVKQGAQASYAQITPIFERFNSAKAKLMDIHLAVAQYAQANGRDNSVLYRGSDGDHWYLDIMKEDGELFPLRKLGVQVITSGKDRKILEAMKQFMLNDNTVTRDMADVLEIMTNSTIIEMKTIALENRKRTMSENAENKQHEQTLMDKQLEAKKEDTQLSRDFTKGIEDAKNLTKIIAEEIAADGRAAAARDLQQEAFDEISKDAQTGIQNLFGAENLRLKEKAIDNTSSDNKDKLNTKMIELGLKAKALNLKQQEINKDKFVATVNKN